MAYSSAALPHHVVHSAVLSFMNYRPVSCLPAAAKFLKLVVCTQTTKFVESNKLLPNSQHGFRAQRSTMPALSEVQQQCAKNTEAKEVTGILMWDLSAAFDCLDSNIAKKTIKDYILDLPL